MGRLFWKFFLFLWLAQLLTALGVGVMIWASHPGRAAADFGPPPPPPFGETGPPPGPPGPPPRSPVPPLPILAGSVVSLVFAAVLATYFARPIRSLRGAFEAAAEGRLDTRVAVSMGRRRDELAELGTGFEHMAARLQALLEAQRRLLHDVSHELRSPLARLQAAADLLRQQPERSAVFVERIERDTRRMDELVGELLTLARVDSGIDGTRTGRADLQDVLAEVAEDARVEAEAKPCRIELDIARAPVVCGDAALLRRALENVVRNAIRHSPAGGRIAVRAEPDAQRGWTRIEIADEGGGVPEADLEAIFGPFFRSGPPPGDGGYGLGLAITRRVIEAHGGKVLAVNRSGGGFVVALSLPVGRPARRD